MRLSSSPDGARARAVCIYVARTIWGVRDERYEVLWERMASKEDDGAENDGEEKKRNLYRISVPTQAYGHWEALFVRQ